MNLFDMKTIIFGHAFTNVIIMLVILWVWKQNGKDFSGILLWLIDYIFQTIGQFLILFRGSIPDFFAIIMANLFIISGLFILYLGLGQFINKKTNKIFNCIYLIIFLILYTYFTIYNPLLAPRVIIFSISVIFFSFQAAYLLLFKVDKELKKITLMAGYIFLLFVFVYLIRLISVFIFEYNNDFFNNIFIDSILIFSSQMVSILLTYSLIIMINSRLFLNMKKYAIEKENMVEELHKLAITDNLTQINNRMRIEQLLEGELLRFKRYTRPLSIVLIDIDYFKSVNDNYGHQVGDEVLKEIVLLFQNNIRKSDIIGRWGGEEFLIVSPENNIDGSYFMAEKLRGIISSHKFINDISLTISLGITITRDGDTMKIILNRVDKALYKAKDKGRNKTEAIII